ncbi:hypothetical protein TBR22_A15600 [Luteitalea sp. TBR-22]|uniref:hypothetical protein n=1 Tax=Luteitalea sp. TBR-22 TaxID=2802971 RepID=UPI001AF7BCB0|nr:hypothetical protein [Luteitalea sp. TBR-22]BCS32350.1 hypothetical protein TBR22_A15600 [Luteitalea sp. TBR-22]
MAIARRFPTFAAAFHRELAEHRLNRFLHVHLGLCAAIGLLPLLTPDAAAASAVAWVLQGTLYCLSLSSLLLGVSAAQGDADEFPLIFTQPAARGAWLAGKATALAAMLAPASLVLVLPAAAIGGVSLVLGAVALAAAGTSIVLGAIGLALGLWVRDHVRGLLAALAAWFGLLFGVDLLLLAVSGAPVVQAHPVAWALPLMLNPLSALRVTMMFGLEQTAPAVIGADPLVSWWLAHGVAWLVGLGATWIAASLWVALAGARRAVDA